MAPHSGWSWRIINMWSCYANSGLFIDHLGDVTRQLYFYYAWLHWVDKMCQCFHDPVPRRAERMMVCSPPASQPSDPEAHQNQKNPHNHDGSRRHLNAQPDGKTANCERHRYVDDCNEPSQAERTWHVRSVRNAEKPCRRSKDDPTVRPTIHNADRFRDRNHHLGSKMLDLLASSGDLPGNRETIWGMSMNINKLKNTIFCFEEYSQRLANRYSYIVATIICLGAAVLSIFSLIEGVPFVPYYFVGISAFTGYAAWRYYRTRSEEPEPATLRGSLITIGLLILCVGILLTGWLRGY